MSLKILKLSKSLIQVTSVVLGLMSAPAWAAAKCPQTISAADRLLAINRVENVMGRYSHDFTEGGLKAIADIFSTRDDTSWKVPQGLTGDKLKALLAKARASQPTHNPWALHIHSMFSPVIEVADDGKTAMGVWDSFGPNINSATNSNWEWNKYGVDFIKEDGEWKVWHLQVFPVFLTPYNRSIPETAMYNSEKNINGALQDTADRPGYTGPNDPLWQFDGKTPMRGPKTPRPYCTYSPELSAAQYAKF